MKRGQKGGKADNEAEKGRLAWGSHGKVNGGREGASLIGLCEGPPS
jgi:hypothetical protein